MRVSVTLEMRVERDAFPSFEDAMELTRECRVAGEQVDFDIEPIVASCEDIGTKEKKA